MFADEHGFSRNEFHGMRRNNMFDQDSTGKVWLLNSAKMREAVGISFDYKPWTNNPGVVLAGVPQRKRFADCIDVGFVYLYLKSGFRLDRGGKVQMNEDVADAMYSWWVDPTQGVQRKPWSNRDIGTNLSGSSWYNYGLDSVLTPSDKMAMMGWMDWNQGSMTDKNINNLIGEAQHLACLGTCVASLLMCCKFPDVFEGEEPNPSSSSRAASGL
jgi:hypothetical protein